MTEKPVMDVCREYWQENTGDDLLPGAAAAKVVELSREHEDGTHEMAEDVRSAIISDFKEWVDRG